LREQADNVNEDAYSPGKFTDGGKACQSPGPPAYQSPQRSPSGNRYTHEIDSTEVHEIEGGQTPDARWMNADGGVEGGVGHGLGLDYVAELPNNSRSQRITR
jgi:hypothetical protein